jgi:hypothetical protein
MTLNDGFERTVSDWLDEQAGHGMPGYLDETLARTTRTRQRQAWSSLERWLPVALTTQTRSFARPTLVKVLLAAAILVALIGIAVVAVGSRVQRVPAPFGVAANGQIAYWANGDILVADPDGTHATPSSRARATMACRHTRETARSWPSSGTCRPTKQR